MNRHPIRFQLALARAKALRDFGALARGEVDLQATAQVRQLYREAAAEASEAAMAILTTLPPAGDPTAALAELGAAEQRLLDSLCEIDRIALARSGGGG